MKAWVYQPRNRPAEIHMRRETVLEDMFEDLDWAMEDGGEWAITDTLIYVDDGGHAELVEIVE